jgi:fumarate reductase subunit D
MAMHAHLRPRPDYRESFWWFVFANGGALAAILAPVHILVQGILGPLGVVSVFDRRYDTMHGVIGNPIVKLYLFVLIAAIAFHWAHRTRFLIMDLGVHGARRFFEVLFYGLAVLISLTAAYILLTT